MYEKFYKVMLWISMLFIALYLALKFDPFGFIGGMLFMILAVIQVIRDYRHGTMPFQKQREFLREKGILKTPTYKHKRK